MLVKADSVSISCGKLLYAGALQKKSPAMLKKKYTGCRPSTGTPAYWLLVKGGRVGRRFTALYHSIAC